jgi:acyl-CoA thioester hydrolase
VITETRITVRYAETDRMGIVHHSNYPIWFEAARTEYIKKLGYSYSKAEENGLLLPLIELRCNYTGSATYEDEILITAQIKLMTPLRLTFYYEVFKNSKPILICTGETAHVWTDRNMKPLNLKKFRPDVYSLLCGTGQKEEST